MNLSKEHFRAIIYHFFKAGHSRQECRAELFRVHGNIAPHQTTINRWYNEFLRGRSSLQDEFRGGRPATAVTEETIAAVRKLIEEDNRVTVRFIRASLGIGISQIQKILHSHLHVKKICARWIPHNLTPAEKEQRVKWCKKTMKRFNRGASNDVCLIVTGDESWIYAFDPEKKEQSRQWVFENEANPTKVQRARSVNKKMIASFFSIDGHVATIALEDRKTVNSEWYITNCLPVVINKMHQYHPRKTILLHHDNARPHTAAATNDYLKTKKVECIGHPPYSPDLAPCDFFLFPNIKDKLRGIRFNTAEEAVEAYRKLLSEVPSEDWKICFKKWLERMDKCVQLGGEYFEKQKIKKN